MLSKRFTLLLLCGLLFTLRLTGQSATFSLPNETGNAGDIVCLPVTVADFSDIVEFGFTLVWEEEALSFSSINNINPTLNNFGIVNQFPAANIQGINTFATAAGSITAYWRFWEDNSTCEALPAGLDLPDDEILFEICLQVVGSGGYGTLHPVSFFNAPQPLVTNKKNGDGSCTEDAILGTVDGSITEEVAPLILTAEVPPGNFQPGDVVCVDIVAEDGFVNMQGLQFGLDWDRTVLQIESVIPNEDIPNNSPFIYNVDVANNCVATSWSYTLDNNGITLADGTVFVSACFRIIGDCGDQTNIEVSDACNGAQIEATNSTIQTLAVVTNPDRLRVDNCNNFGLDVIVSCGAPVNVGDNICIDITAGDNYTAINSYDYLLRFDEDVLSFTGTQGYLAGAAVTAGDFNLGNVNNGILGVDINHTPFGPISANPGDVIFQACFDVIGYAPSVPITVSDPSSVNESNPDLLLIGVDAQNCEIVINQPDQVIMSFGTVDVSSTQDACLPVTVSNFVDINSISFTLQYDATGASFDFVSLANQAFPGATVTDLGSGLLLFEYNGPGVTLPDGAVLFDLCLRAQTDAVPAECSAIDLAPFPLVPQAGSTDGTIDGIVTVAGEACVLFPEGFGLIFGSATTGISSDVCIPVRVVSFDNITSANFNINFDPSFLAYNGISLTGGWPGLTLGDVDETNSGIGSISVSWTSAGGPLAIVDSTIVFELCFNTLETPGCYDIDGNASVQPSATTSNGDGSILFTDGEVCVENRVIITDKTFVEALCAGQCNARIIVTATTGGENPQDVFIRLDNPLSTVFSGDTINNVCPGWNYFTAYTADGDLTIRDSIFVDFDMSQMPMADAGMDQQLSCNNTTCTLISGNGNVGSTYNLYRDLSGTLSFIESGTIDNGSFTYCSTSDGTFILEVTNDNGCTSFDTVVISAPVLPVADAGPTTVDLTCDNSPIMLDGAGSTTDGIVTYMWERILGGTIVDTVSTTLNVTIDSAGRYRLTVFFPQSQCSATDEIIVTDMRDPPNVDISEIFTLGCDGSPAFIDAGPEVPGFVYTFRDQFNTIVSATSTFTTSTLGDYTLTVLNPETGCETVKELEIVASQGDPVVSDLQDQPLNCDGDTITLMPTYTNVSGNQTYSWTSADGAFVIGEQDEANPLVIGTGTYVVTVDDGGCSTTDSIVVVDPVLPVASAGNDMNLMCGQSLTIDGSGSQSDNASYLWYTMNDTIDGATTNMLTVDEPGLYVIEVRDLNTQCRNTDTVEVLPAVGFPMVMLPDTIFGLTCADDSLLVNPQTQTNGDPFTLDISGPGAPEVNPDDPTTVLVYEPGTYVLSATNDNNGCTANFTFVVDGSQIQLPFAALTNGIRTITCVQPTVILSGVISSSGPNITYRWDNIQGGETPNMQGNDTLMVSTPGLYQFAVTNTETQCTAFDTVLVQDGRNFPQATAAPFEAITCDDPNTTLSVNIQDTSGMTIQWFGPPVGDPPVSLIATNVLSIDISGPGNYVAVIVDNASSCITQVNYNVELDDEGISDIQFADVEPFDCSTESVTIDASASVDNTDGLTIEWESLDGNTVNPPNGSLIVSVTGAGSYVLTLTAGAGCTNSDTIFVEAADNTPFADAGEDLEIECGEMPMLEGQNSTPAPLADSIIYTWNAVALGSIVSGGDTPNPVVSGAGTYELLVTNLINLCESRDTVMVTLLGQEAAMLPTDFGVCSDTAMVTGNQPAGTTGTWTASNGGDAQVSFNGNVATITNLTDAVTLTWTLSAPGCEDYSVDSVTVSRESAPVAVDDDLVILGNGGVGNIDVLSNDQRGSGVTATLLDTVPFGEVIFLNGDLTFSAGQGVSGSFSLRYEICSNSCGLCSEAVVNVRVDADGERPPVFNAITPNGDRLNEPLVFDLLNFQPEDFPDNSLIIFNRWGDILYEAKPYNNDWDGRSQNGDELPEGTYYYILRLNLGEGDIIRGDVTILR